MQKKKWMHNNSLGTLILFGSLVSFFWLRTKLSLRAVTCNTCYGWAHLMLQVVKVKSWRWNYKFLWDVTDESSFATAATNIYWVQPWWIYMLIKWSMYLPLFNFFVHYFSNESSKALNELEHQWKIYLLELHNGTGQLSLRFQVAGEIQGVGKESNSYWFLLVLFFLYFLWK